MLGITFVPITFDTSTVISGSFPSGVFLGVEKPLSSLMLVRGFFGSSGRLLLMDSSGIFSASFNAAFLFSFLHTEKTKNVVKYQEYIESLNKVGSTCIIIIREENKQHQRRNIKFDIKSLTLCRSCHPRSHRRCSF